MNPKNISAEEKLLRLIKGKAKHKAPIEKHIPSKEDKEVTKVRDIKFNRHFFDYIAISACIILLCFFMLQLLAQKEVLLRKVKVSRDLIDDKANVTASEKPYTYFTGNIDRRQLFSASFQREETPKQIGIQELKGLIKDISLVGIISKQGKFVAIIEDKNVNKTYFLNEEDRIGDLILKKIEEGKVILEYYGEEVDLHL